MSRKRNMRATLERALLGAAIILLLSACATSPVQTTASAADCEPSVTKQQAVAESQQEAATVREPKIVYLTKEVARKSSADRVSELENTVQQLQFDLDVAEGTLVSVESGLRAGLTRADAVAKLAEARIRLRRVSEAQPWRTQLLQEANGKLDKADTHIGSSNYGAAIFFIHRAERLLSLLQAESGKIANSKGVYIVDVDRANLRAAPSVEESILTVLNRGTPLFWESSADSWYLVRTMRSAVGWIHQRLVRPRDG